MNSRRLRVVALLLIICSMLSSTQSASAQSSLGGGLEMPGSPLKITVFDDGSVGLTEADTNQCYNHRASGVFLWINGLVYGPTVPAGNSMIPYTLIEQRGPDGLGTSEDPWRITPDLGVGETGVRV